MTARTGPAHVVVDGSNIATEGRSMPSLAQLSDAVASFMEEHPGTAITVVVDATFGHRIDKKEVKEFEDGIANNELVAPPAGAVGRGDAFVLGIAQKANAAILSNDSFQEFHGDYEWLFEPGRLIGGKPVPHVGWVFVDRVPVRGPISRKATGATRGGGRRTKKSAETDGRSRKVSAAANEPMPVPKSPPPRAAAASQPADPAATAERKPVPRAGDVVNELMPFLEFVQHHPVGTSVSGIVDSYSSHGAYVAIGNENVRAYVPLRLMANPAPTSARRVMRLGESVTLVVVSYSPARRSIDCAVPDLAAAAIEAARAEAAADGEATDALAGTEPGRRPRAQSARKSAAATKAPAKKRSSATQSDVPPAPGTDGTPAKRPARTRRSAATTDVATMPGTDGTPATKPPAARKAVTRRAAARKAPAEQAAAEGPATESPAKKSPAKKSPARKSPAKQAPAKRAVAETSATKKAPAKRPAAKKAAAKRAPAKRAPAKRTAASRSPARRTADGEA